MKRTSFFVRKSGKTHKRQCRIPKISQGRGETSETALSLAQCWIHYYAYRTAVSLLDTFHHARPIVKVLILVKTLLLISI